MTLLDVEELTRYWLDHPPLHLMAAAYLGIGKGNGKRTNSRSAAVSLKNGKNADVGPLLAALGSSFAGADVHTGLAPVVLDFAELKRGIGPTQ
jgi:hypothetical protein